MRDLLAAFDIPADRPADVSDGYAYLQNRTLGVELTFKTADALAHWVPPRADAADALVLVNIRVYGEGSTCVSPTRGNP